MANPGAPFWAAQMAEFSFGIFCMIEVASSLDTPGTATGFIQTVEDAPGFDWPDQCRVPASPGIADNCGGGLRNLPRLQSFTNGPSSVFFLLY